MTPAYGRAFGIDVEAAFPIPELPPLPDGPRAERTMLERVAADELRRYWPADEATRLVDRTFPDGTPMMVVESHEDAGFHVWAPRYGRHVVSGDGTRVRSALPRVAAWRWERLLFAQVLPLAAALRGRGLLHASAVAIEESAFGFTGLPGAGKSSVAVHLVARGASLVTDDVLAVEIARNRVRAHTGAALAGVDQREIAAIDAEGRARLGSRLGRSDKTYFAAPIVARDPLPLSALYFLARGRGRSIEIGATDVTPAQLLGSSFISYLRSSQHLARQLDVCARIAGSVPTFQVSIPGSASASAAAAAVEAHLRTLSEPH
jgi:hypothetical protein